MPLLTNVPCMVCWPWNLLRLLLTSSPSLWKILAFLLGPDENAFRGPLEKKISLLPPSPLFHSFFFFFLETSRSSAVVTEVTEFRNWLLRKQESTWLMHRCAIKQIFGHFIIFFLWWMRVDLHCELLTESPFLIPGTHVAFYRFWKDIT